LSDGYLVVYYPHMLVHPEHQGKGIGRTMMKCLQQKYKSFHQQILVADGNAIEFYKSIGWAFSLARGVPLISQPVMPEIKFIINVNKQEGKL